MEGLCLQLRDGVAGGDLLESVTESADVFPIPLRDEIDEVTGVVGPIVRISGTRELAQVGVDPVHRIERFLTADGLQL